jgi:antitoxin ParD1/3/4
LRKKYNAITQPLTPKRDRLTTHQSAINHTNKFDNSYCYLLLLQRQYSYHDYYRIRFMNVSLTPELESFIQGKVNTGLYYSASEVVREGLRLLQERDQLQQLRLQELSQDIQAGLDSGDATPLDIQAVKAKARQRKQQNQVQ